MSLKPQAIPPIPQMTVTVAQTAFRKGNPYMQMRDELGTFFSDDQFIQLYPSDGQPAYSPWRLALVSVMQFAENLTDRQASDAVRARIDWKYALSLELTDEGFDFSVLSEFRQRLLEHEVGIQLLDQMLSQFREMGLLDTHTQRTDSSYVLGNVADLNRLEFAGRTLQQALDDIASIAPAWIQDWVSPEWYQRYSQPISDYRLPKKDQERQQLALQIGQDGLSLLETLYLNPEVPSYLRELEAVEILRQIWLQRFVLMDGELQLRERKDMPPAARLLQSPFDVAVRFSRKQKRTWLGYKVHVTETCDTDDAPNLITNVMICNATSQDYDAVEVVHNSLQNRHLLPDIHLVDRGYTSAPLLYDSQQDFGVELFGPVVEKKVWQHETGYDMSAFTIDWKKRTVTCPQGHTSNPWTMREHRRDHKLTRVKFKRAECEPCPVHDLCTKHHRRTLSFHEEEVYKINQQRKIDQHTTIWHDTYGKRSGIEGTISQGVFALGARRSRYRGEEKTELQFIFTAMAMNLSRVLNWQNNKPRSQKRKTRLGKLAA